MRLKTLPAAFVVAALARGAWAAVPGEISYQGRLTDQLGNPLSGSFSMTFKLWNSLTGGTNLWTESQGSVAASSGVINVQLGSVTPIPYSVAYGTETPFLEITVAGDTLSPRQPLNSVAFAFTAHTLDGSSPVGIGTTNPASPLDIESSNSASPVDVIATFGGPAGSGQGNGAGINIWTTGPTAAILFSTGSNVPAQSVGYISYSTGLAGGFAIGTFGVNQVYINTNGTVNFPNQVCLGGSCISSWPAGGGGGQWTTTPDNTGVYTSYNVGIDTGEPQGVLDIEYPGNQVLLNVGNVGIGTNQPIAVLDVENTSNSNYVLLNTDAVNLGTSLGTMTFLNVNGIASASEYIASPFGGGLLFEGEGLGTNLDFSAFNSSATIDVGPNALAFLQGGSEAMRITNNQMVGIGTTNPLYPLTVNYASPSGPVAVFSAPPSGGGNDARVFFTSTGTFNLGFSSEPVNVGGGLPGAVGYEPNLPAMVLGTLDNPSLFVRTDHIPNYVGIATTNPQAELQVAGHVIVSSGIAAGSGMQHARASTGSIPGTTGGAVSLSWSTPFTDTNYTVTCSVEDSPSNAQALRFHHVSSKGTGGITAIVYNDDSSADTGTLDCIAMHD